MSITLDSRESAAARFNALHIGRTWTPADMALFDVHVTGWPEGIVPERVWLPIDGLLSQEAAALALGIAQTSISSVRRLDPNAQASVERAISAADWKRYGGGQRVIRSGAAQQGSRT